jgi:hypothetical protein
MVSFRMRFIDQEERKTLTFEYHRSEATKRTYAPQQLFGLLAKDLARGDYFLEVDLDDPFFRTFAVHVDVPVEFQKIGLRQATVALDYGDPAVDAEGHRHTDLVFTPADAAPRTWEVSVNRTLDLDYAHRIEFEFDPQSAWQGGRSSYSLPTTRTADRTLSLNPYAHIAFVEVDVFANRVDWGSVASIDVQLVHEAPSGWKVDRLLTLTEAAPRQGWKLRADDADHRAYTHTVTHRLKDGSTRVMPATSTEATSLAIDDPFPAALDLRFVPQVTPGAFSSIIVDVEYDDPANGYERRERVEIPGVAPAQTGLRIGIVDPKLRAFRHRTTLIGPNGEITQGPLVDGTTDIVAVGPPPA